MTAESGNGRTHEPALREVVAELDGLRDVMNERDRLYAERDTARKTAVDAALVAQEKATSVAMAAADRANSKAELANEKRFEGVNEFRGQLSDQAATFLPRAEAAARFEALTEKVEALRRSKSEDMGSALRSRELLAWLVGAATVGFLVIRIATGH
jgi:hypothetical protein